jgi:hypothetical protein
MKNRFHPVISHHIILPICVLVGIIVTVAIFYPGYLSPDSLVQLSQGRSGVFNDWHPPVMSWLWGIFDRMIPGPLAM